MNTFDFMKTTARDYRVGAIFASSCYAAERVVQGLKPEYEYIVEYGAGDGIITKKVAKLLPPHGKLVAVELNRNFLQELKTINDERITVKNEDVRTLSKNLLHLDLPQIDAVISGIPFSFLTKKERIEVVENTYRALVPGGTFLVYQYTPLMFMILKKYFSSVELQFEPLNFPPYFIMKAEK